MSVDPLAGLLDESASLWDVVHSIERHVNRLLATHTYTGATDHFFGYVRDLARGTKALLSSNAREAREATEVHRVRLQAATLRRFWLLLHELIQPAGEAHSLTTPAALIELAAEQLRQIPGLSESKVVVSLSPRLMYHQTTHTSLSLLGKQLEVMVPTAKFPQQLGFVALPYSQGPSFFPNLLLYHELGHFVFEELSSNSHPTFEALETELLNAVAKIIPTAPPEQKQLALTILRTWTHEIFCDLFAISLVGPCFSFAFVELLGLLSALQPDVTIVFNQTHPASACRFRQHLEFLESASWWAQLSDLDAPAKHLLESLARQTEDSYLIELNGNSGKDPVLIPAFLQIIPSIHALVKEITRPAAATTADFKVHRSLIENCLLNGVVPSVVNPETNSTATPVAVINASFTFYLTSLDRLMASLGRDPRDIEARSLWKHQVEMWTEKALEDIRLLDQRRRAESNGSSIQAEDSRPHEATDR